MFNTTVKNLLNEALEERSDLFLIDFTISNDQSINIIIDGDNGVRVEDCMFISRAIEHNIDREEHDFSLEVASNGATAPLVLPRQFVKNIGRTLDVRTKTESIEAALINASNEGETFSNKFHVFSLIWDENTIQFQVDGVNSIAPISSADWISPVFT